MSKLVGKLRKPEPDKKKIAIIAAVIAVVCLSASAGLYYVFKDKTPDQDEFGRRPREWRDANMPNPNKQTVQEIMDFRNSDKFRQLSQREQFMYTMASGRQVMEYQMETYFTLPKEEKTAYLDKIIDLMQAQRAGFEQMRQQRPRRDANDPNMQRRRDRANQQNGAGGRRTPNPSRMRARSERGTPEQRAQRTAFMEAIQKRMQERGISMPSPGGRGGRGGGR